MMLVLPLYTMYEAGVGHDMMVTSRYDNMMLVLPLCVTSEGGFMIMLPEAVVDCAASVYYG